MVEPVSAIATSIQSTALGAPGGAVGGGAAGGGAVAQTSPGAQASPGAQTRFDAALQAAGHASPLAGHGDVPRVMSGLFDTLDSVDSQAKSVSDYARSAEASGSEMTPGEMVNLTMRCQEFMFQCQLTSNIANRGADGVQQLFRQQG